MKEQDLEELLEDEKQAKILKLEFVFYSLTALNSAGYIAYVLVYYQLVTQAIGGKNSAYLALLIFAFSLLLEALLEIPTGMYGDKKGHQKSVLLSFLFLTIHSVFYLGVVFLGPSSTEINWTACVLIILAEILLALGTALQTGSLNSWFVVNFRNLGYKDEPLHKYMGRRRLVTNVVWLITGSIVLLIGTNYKLSVAFIIGITAYLLAFVLTKKLAKPTPSHTKKEAVNLTLRKYMREEFNGAMAEIFRNRKLTIVTITHSIYWTLALMLIYFWQEILKLVETDKNNLTLKYVVAWLLIAFARIIGAKLSEGIKTDPTASSDKRVSNFIIGQILLSLPILFILGFKYEIWSFLTVGAVLLAVSRIGQEFSKPISMAWTHEEIKNDKYRATTESLIEASAGFVIVLILVLIFLLETYGINFDSQIVFVVLILSCAVLFINIPLTWLINRNRIYIKEKDD